MKTTPERLAEAFTRARQHWKRRRPGEILDLPTAPLKPRFSIAISREAGAGGATVAQSVGRRLDWPVYHR